jgi:hypothetical protein
MTMSADSWKNSGTSWLDATTEPCAVSGSPFAAGLTQLPDHFLLVVGLALAWDQQGDGLLRRIAFDEERRRRALYTKPGTARRRTLRRSLSLDWWYLPYTASLLLRPRRADSRETPLDEVHAEIDGAWQLLTRRLKPEPLPALSTLRRAAPQRHQEHPELTAHASRELHLLFDLPAATDEENDVDRRLAELYDLHQATLPERTDNPYENLAYLPRAPIDPHRLEEEWDRVRAEVQLAIDTYRIPGQKLVSHPLLDVLKSRILSEWTWLSEPYVFASCMRLVGFIEGNFAAAWLALNWLKIALILGGDSWRAEQVAQYESAYLARTGHRELLGERADGTVYPPAAPRLHAVDRN